MGKTLIVMRHGEAAGISAGINDFNRPLTEHGINEVTRAGVFLNGKNAKLQLVLHSAAVRTSITAEIMAQVARVSLSQLQASDTIYNAPLGVVIQAISEVPDGIDCLMVVGHNPTLSYLAEYYTNEPIRYLDTANMICMAFDAVSWREIGKGLGQFQWMYEGMQR